MHKEIDVRIVYDIIPPPGGDSAYERGGDARRLA